jgi:hypothetical protein
MDPITAAVVAALTAGVTASGPKIVEKTIVDAYDALKNVIKQKLGTESKVARAIMDLEEDPTSEGYKAVLKEQIAKAKADQDKDVLLAANALLDKISTEHGGEQHRQTITGNYNAQADRGSTASVNINHQKS